MIANPGAGPLIIAIIPVVSIIKSGCPTYADSHKQLELLALNAKQG